jgi:hypothetical protein
VAGISQVWLTAEELEALASALDGVVAESGGTVLPRALVTGRDKIELALKPVACEIASGPKTP